MYLRKFPAGDCFSMIFYVFLILQQGSPHLVPFEYLNTTYQPDQVLKQQSQDPEVLLIASRPRPYSNPKYIEDHRSTNEFW